MTKTMPEGTVLGEIGDEVVFENDRVRVWGLTLEPGEIQGWHQHHLPYIVVPLTEGKNVMRWADGREKQTAEKPGDALWREASEPHELENTSGWTYRNLLIELK